MLSRPAIRRAPSRDTNGRRARSARELEAARSCSFGSQGCPRYVDGPEVGRGGMGVVLLCHDYVLGREVAMKRLLREDADKVLVRSLLWEARVTSQLDHPGIVEVLDLGLDADGRAFFTMKLVRGNMDLATVIERLRAGDRAVSSRFDLMERVRILAQVCRAVDYAHSRGVLHCDLKPSNIMIGLHGEVIVLDWGMATLTSRCTGALAQLAHAEALPAGDEDHIQGTLLYMAPEQLRASSSEASDIYGLAAIAAELLSLEHYLGPPSAEFDVLVRQIASQEPRLTEIDHPDGLATEDLSEVCLQGLAKDPVFRQPSAGEMADQLEAWLSEIAAAGAPVEDARHEAQGLPWAAVALASIMVLIAMCL